ncbi:hypothetical protein EAF04_000926 [Stromatinia cepivora]|nr:hypothetical protein EAF04_000926 [Stromatinia cepivora]
MRSSTVAFAVTLALANSASVLATQTGDSQDISISSATTSVVSTTSLSALIPVTTAISIPPSSVLSSSSVSGKPGVYSNSTSFSTATISGTGAGTSTATATTEVPGVTTGASKTGPSAGASASASSSSSAADALLLNGASWSMGSLMLGGMAVVFGFF